MDERWFNGDIQDKADDAAQAVNGCADDASQAANGYAYDAAQAVNDYAGSAAGYADGAAQAVNDYADDAAQAVNDYADDAAQAVNAYADDAAQAVNDYADGAAQAVDDYADGAAQAVSGYADDTAQAVDGYAQASDGDAASSSRRNDRFHYQSRFDAYRFRDADDYSGASGQGGQSPAYGQDGGAGYDRGSYGASDYSTDGSSSYGSGYSVGADASYGGRNDRRYSAYDTGRRGGSVPPAGGNPPSSGGGGKKKGGAGKVLAAILAAVLLGAIVGLVAFGVTRFLGNSSSVSGDSSSSRKSLITGDGAEDGASIESDGASASAEGSGTAAVKASSEDLSIPDVVEQCMPAMVSITTTSVSEYYSIFGGAQSQTYKGAGTGIIFADEDERVLIVTNAHVVEGANDITVTFVDDAAVEGTVIAEDDSDDLAVIAVAKTDMETDTQDAISVIKIGDSDDTKIGETVIAIGNAKGYGQSVSRGIVSAKERPVSYDDGTTHYLIQTDAAINPGNSGGALLNMKGEVIGINEGKTVDESVEGMGYAIPINTAMPIIEKLQTKANREKVSEEDAAYLGVSVVTMHSYYVSLGYPEGVSVTSVTEGGPADEAGIEENDIITAIDGTTVTSLEEFQEEFAYCAAGDEVEFTVSRVNEERTGFDTLKITVKLGSKSEVGDLTVGQPA